MSLALRRLREMLADAERTGNEQAVWLFEELIDQFTAYETEIELLKDRLKSS